MQEKHTNCLPNIVHVGGELVGPTALAGMGHEILFLTWNDSH